MNTKIGCKYCLGKKIRRQNEFIGGTPDVSIKVEDSSLSINYNSMDVNVAILDLQKMNLAISHLLSGLRRVISTSSAFGDQTSMTLPSLHQVIRALV